MKWDSLNFNRDSIPGFFKIEAFQVKIQYGLFMETSAMNIFNKQALIPFLVICLSGSFTVKVEPLPGPLICSAEIGVTDVIKKPIHSVDRFLELAARLGA